MKYCNTSLACVALSLSLGCVIDTVPLPEARSKPDAAGDSAEAPYAGAINADALYYTENPVVLAGTGGTVGAGLTVAVTNPSRPDWQSSTRAASNGSFSLPVNAKVGENLVIRLLAADSTEIAALGLHLTPASADASLANAALGDSIAAIGSDNGAPFLQVSPAGTWGLIEIYGPPGLLPPAIGVVVANLSQGSATRGRVFEDGSFWAQLTAASGDELALFAVEPARSHAGSAPLILYVP